MHSSSRMRTGRTLTVFRWGRGGLWSGGCTCLVWGDVWFRGCVYLVWGGVPAWSGGCLVLGGVTWSGGCMCPGGCTWSGGVPAWSGGCTCLVWGGGVPAWSRVDVWSWGVYLVWGVYLPGRGEGCTCPGGVYLVRGGGCTCLVWGVSGPGGVPAWSGGCTCPGGVPGPEGGCTILVWGGAWSGTPPPCGQTHACENITLAKTSFRPVKIVTRSCNKIIDISFAKEFVHRILAFAQVSRFPLYFCLIRFSISFLSAPGISIYYKTMIQTEINYLKFS